MKLCYTLLSTVVIMLSLTGCSTDFFKTSPEGRIVDSVKPASQVIKPVRQNVTQVGRYSSITNIATSSQENPLLAISQFKFGARVKTVGQALWQVLQDTGYSLVPEHQLSISEREVLSKPLPVTQRELGPISVSNALRTLMGNKVFTLMVDPVHRLVTFKLKSKFLNLKRVS